MAPTLAKVFLGLATVLSLSSAVTAESHTIAFDNQCGMGTPTLILNGQIVSTGEPYTQTSTISGIAYLQTGNCGFNGENCTLMEMTLNDPTCPGCGSSTDISLIPPHAFNVEASFSYYNGCNGQGTTCSSADCSEAFHVSTDNQVQVACELDDVNLLITFCGNAMTNALVVGGSGSVQSSSSAPLPATSSAAPSAAPPVTSSAAPPAASSAAPPAASSAAPPAISSAAPPAASSAAPPATPSVASSAIPVSVSTNPASNATQTLVAVSSSLAAPSSSPSASSSGTCKNKKRMERRRKLARAHEQLSH